MHFIRDNYGSYTGLSAYVRFLVIGLSGRYQGKDSVNWRCVRRFVFVCKGNVCRSPYAQGRLSADGGGVVSAISFGLETSGHIPANADAMRVAQSRGVDLSTHSSQSFERNLLKEGDLIVAFEPSHLREIRRRLDDNLQHTVLAGMWSDPLIQPYIADPYGKSDKYFNVCFDVIDNAVRAMLHEFKVKNDI